MSNETLYPSAEWWLNHLHKHKKYREILKGFLFTLYLYTQRTRSAYNHSINSFSDTVLVFVCENLKNNFHFLRCVFLFAFKCVKIFHNFHFSVNTIVFFFFHLVLLSIGFCFKKNQPSRLFFLFCCGFIFCIFEKISCGCG